jgi:hypothetical protein
MRNRTLPFALFASLIPSFALGAQAWSYPALQPPRIANREFNFGVADAGGGGTSLLFQWREAAATRSMLSFDAGVVAPDTREGDNAVFVFGQYAYQSHRATDEVPLDFLFTLGAGVALGSGSVLRVPVGMSMGNRFELQNDMAITPWLHPRISLDACDCRGDDLEVGVAFDVGANLELSPRLAVRVAALFAGNEAFSNDGVALSLAWTPAGLRRSTTPPMPRHARWPALGSDRR